MDFPRNLKGSDLVIYSIFQSLGFEVSARPVLQDPFWYHDERIYDDDESGDESESDTQQSLTRQGKTDKNEKERRRSISFVGTNMNPHGDYDAQDVTYKEERQTVRLLVIVSRYGFY